MAGNDILGTNSSTDLINLSPVMSEDRMYSQTTFLMIDHCLQLEDIWLLNVPDVVDVVDVVELALLFLMVILYQRSKVIGDTDDIV